MSHNKGRLFVISGPSGTGKGTICAEILKDINNEFSVSMTTRAPREGEVHGREYFFVTHEEFIANIEKGSFLEHASVFDNYYGTPKDIVLKRLEKGRNLIQPALEHLMLFPAGNDGEHRPGAVPGRSHTHGIGAVPADGVDCPAVIGGYYVLADYVKGFSVNILCGVHLYIRDVPAAHGGMAAGEVLCIRI